MFGSGFGTSTAFGASTTTVTTTSAAPSFGFAGFGTKTATTAAFGANTFTPSFGGATAFGAGKSAFGTTTTGALPFGTGAAGFGTGSTGFGAGTSGFGTGTSGFGSGTGSFGTGTFGSGTGGFGTGTGSLGFNTSGFGAGSSAFGSGTSGFGTGTGGFGAGSSFGSGGGSAFSGNTTLGFGATGAFGQTGTQQQLPDQLTALATALSLPLIYGDERDALLAKWHQLQAFWGTGKGWYAPNAAPITFTPDNVFCRFKAVSYSRVPTAKNEDGLCSIFVNKKDTEVTQQQQALVDSLYKIFVSKPTLSVCVDGVKPLADNKCEVVIYVLERSPNGATKRVPAVDLFNFLHANRSQLTTLGIENVIPKVAPTKEQLEEYLKTPPAGIDPLIWQQAKLDNPNPQLLIPVPMTGFSELNRRLKFQEQETKLHQGRLDMIASEILELQRNQTTTQAKVLEYKRKLLELSHRLLKVMKRQEVARKQGYAIQIDEEQLRVQLEAIQNELNAPTQFKGRLNELMSQMRMQNQTGDTRWEDRYNIDETLQQEIKQHLRKEQDGIAHLISILKDDAEDLAIIQQDLQTSAIQGYRR